MIVRGMSCVRADILFVMTQSNVNRASYLDILHNLRSNAEQHRPQARTELVP